MSKSMYSKVLPLFIGKYKLRIKIRFALNKQHNWSTWNQLQM